jgi:hypothetical protein
LTIFGTPGGTPLNQTGGFQGTQPGNPVGASLSPVNPGGGLFPPGSNNQSGDTVMASASRAAMPLNADLTNYGTRDSRPGQAILEVMGKGAVNGASANTVNPYLWANGGSSGGNSLGGGGMNQTDGPGAGETSILAGSAPSTAPTLGSPAQYQG